MIAIKEGVIRLEADGQSFTPHARDIYPVVFSGADSIAGIPTSADELYATGLEFESSTATLVVSLSASERDGLPVIHLKLCAKVGGLTVPVAAVADEYFDYVILGRTWSPLPFGACDEVQRHLCGFEVSADGEISFRRYLDLIAEKSALFEIQDEAAAGLVAVEVANQTVSPLPSGFKGTLFPYQQAGYGWLSFMASQSIGCILADEMGLGKTVQVVCMVLKLREEGAATCLVISPATLLENWRREFAKFAPDATILIHRGARRAGLINDLQIPDVVVTSFETAVSDISMLTSIKWGAVIVDEAQGIKNPAAKRTLALKTIPTTVAVAVTGTPVENSLKDLWSITDFIAPALLGSLTQFEKDHPDTSQGASAIEPRVTPLILRRRVRDVAKDLPSRIDIPVAIEMDPASVAEYERVRQNVVSRYGRTGALVALGTLRQFCGHPWLVESLREQTDAMKCSQKLVRLLEIIEEIRTCGEKAIVFASFQAVVDLIAAELTTRLGISATVIDGRIPVERRQPMVDEFSLHRESALLVMIPRATGVGLNITAANHVIHYTPEWNPAIEDQASARAYRRGQDKVVRVHRLFYAGTVEQVMSDRMDSKRDLAETAVIGSDGLEVDAADLSRALNVTPGY